MILSMFKVQLNQIQSKDKGYRVGYSYHKIYDGNNLPSEEVLNQDLINMLNAYDAVSSNGGRNLDIKIPKNKKSREKKYEDNEDIYQNPPSNKRRKKSIKSPNITEKEKMYTQNIETKVRPRNSDYGEEAKENAQEEKIPAKND